jgi:phospholipid/cholesterol/gamma-HCH transport system ATP-binding protein
MIEAPPILEMIGAVATPLASRLPPTALDIRVMPEDSVLIGTRDPSQATDLADVCCGLASLQSGVVKFLGHDWANASFELASALRGRIGQVSVTNSWVGFLSTDANILLQQLHHTRTAAEVLRDRAAELSRNFGLPGIPLAPPDELSFEDLVRAACVRAFLGAPRLIILKSPELEQVGDVRQALFDAVTAARNRRAAAVWLTSSEVFWNDRYVPATRRLRLTDHGLVPARIGS